MLAKVAEMMALKIAVRLAEEGGGTPRYPAMIVVGAELVVWQPDGEVKTLRRKP